MEVVRLGWCMRRPAILPYLVRPARAHTLDYVANPGHGAKPPHPGFFVPKNGVWSGLEAGVRLAVVEQVADAVHRVLEDRGGGKHDHADGGIDEWDDGYPEALIGRCGSVGFALPNETPPCEWVSLDGQRGLLRPPIQKVIDTSPVRYYLFPAPSHPRSG